MIMRSSKAVADKIIHLSVFLSFFCTIHSESDAHLHDDVTNVGFSCWTSLFPEKGIQLQWKLLLQQLHGVLYKCNLGDSSIESFV